MKTQSTECPRCNADQTFAPRRQDLGWAIEIYLYCTMCRWRHHLRYTTSEIQLLEKRERKIKRRAEYETQHHGSVSNSTAAAWTRIINQLVELRRALAAEETQHAQ